MKNTLIVILFTTLLASLTACSVVPSSNNGGSSANTVDSSSAEVRRANTLLRQGKKLEAADAYYKASRNQASPQRERLILQAAEIATYVKDKSLARHYFSKVKAAGLSNENRARRSYVQALIAILDNNYQAALKILPSKQGSISTNLWNKIYRVRQQASAQTGGSSSNAHSGGGAVLPQSTNKIAVLLPLSGKLGSIGNTILKGIKASQQSTSSETQIKTYDVGSADILSQYKKAVDEGADVIIGPLDKRKLSTLVNQNARLARPVVSLNHLNAGQGRAPAALYQFGLAPEDEARQVAGFASSRGLRRAAVLFPDSQWGQRLSDAFKQMYASQGGQIVAEVAYPNAGSSYKQSIKQLFASGTGNIDMIFLAASPTQARLIRPMIQHLKGENIPVYATSHIYSGQPNAGQNIDLNGIIYTEIPYIIEGSQLGAITAGTGKYPRLYAMGSDALLIAKNLSRMARSGQPLQGKTGSIRLGGNRFLQRKLSWATFTNGLVTSYGE